MNILGINSFFEHPAVALVRDGRLVFALEDERLTRIKHGKAYTPYRTYIPYAAIYEALSAEGLQVSDIDEISYSYNRWMHLGSLWGCFTGRRLSSFREEMAAFQSVANVPRALVSGYEVPNRYRHILKTTDLRLVPYKEWDHHLCHAASAFFCSTYPSALVVVADGSGENACTSVYRGRGRTLTKVDQISLPHSLGIFYSFVTRHLGFEPFSDEYKVMGLAAYGQPRFKNEMSTLLSLENKGRYRLDSKKLRQLEQILGPSRMVGAPIEQIHKDIAHSAQAQLETVLQHVITYYMKSTDETHLCLAGGTFLNCVANGRISLLPCVEEVFVQPAAHDAGTAIGAAALSSIRRGGPAQLAYDSMFLGTASNESAIESALKAAGATYEELDEITAIERLAQLLAHEKVVAVYRGRMEFGPRSLGNRSILASPMSTRTREKINNIKGREQFRPIAPIVTSEAFAEFFEGVPNRFMMFAVKAREGVRERIPAVVHADGTSRTQIVSVSEDRFLHAVLERFGQHTGAPVLINSSLNVRGRPIDATPQDALASFYTSGIDYMLIGSFLVSRWRAEIENNPIAVCQVNAKNEQRIY